MEFQEIMHAEMKPDVYGGEKCDQVVPRWEVYGEGDMDLDFLSEPIKLDFKHFPPGTTVIVSVPCCPKCGQIVELCKSDDGCEFDWDEWVQNEYS